MLLAGCLCALTAQAEEWAFEETFDADPAAPSQAALPRDFDYVVTHRTHPKEQFTKVYAPFGADHGMDCSGPNPAIDPLPQHLVHSTQTSDGENHDTSFFVCRNHMMSALGEVEFYSNSAFWPRQAFDFSAGGVLEFDVNISEGYGQRMWWEVLIVPRDQLKVSPAPLDSAVDEIYPRDRIVFEFRNTVRAIRVGSGALDPAGWSVDERQFARYDWAYWSTLHPDDPATHDRRVRRRMRMTLEQARITWGIETATGEFDEYSVALPAGLPFTRGLVLFKTHAYTPTKDGNVDTYTFHWDNIRFDGPVVGRYETHVADDVVYLQADGNRPIGDTETVRITLPAVGANPVLFGQINGALKGQARLSINDRPAIAVDPYHYGQNDCVTGQFRDWASFRLPLQPDWMRPGVNTLRWSVGPRPACATNEAWWDGYSIKFLQIQVDSDADIEPSEDAQQIPVPPAVLGFLALLLAGLANRSLRARANR